MALLTARHIALAVVFLTGVTLGVTSLAATATSWWVGDLAAHFRVQYAAAALVELLVLGWTRHWMWAAAALVALAVNGIAAAPVLGGGSVIRGAFAASPTAFTDSRGLAADAQAAATDSQGAGALRIVSINVLFHNAHYDRVVAFLRRAQPDAAVLVEVTPRWRAALGALRDEFPSQYYAPGQESRGGDSHGTLLVSRWPLERIETVPMGPHADPTITAVLSVRGRALHLIGVHPSWPLGLAVSAERNRELDSLAALARATPAPLIMVGDFNVTPFSPHFRAFVTQSGLRWAAQGAGWQPTWPTFFPVGGIQIDHAFVSQGIDVRRFVRGPGIGSDHRPILVDFEW